MDDDNLTDEVSKFLSGFKMIYSTLISELQNMGIKEIDAKGKNDILGIDEKLDNLEHLISSMEANNNNQEEENKENENKPENEGLDEQNNQEEGDMKNLEQMKDALKQEIENKIKNKSDNSFWKRRRETKRNRIFNRMAFTFIRKFT